jgi:hypothetical protein
LRKDELNWRRDFPIRDKVLGFTVRATEEGRKGTGYEFAAYSEMSPYSALGRVRDKMRRGLATRHITGSPGDYQMTHDQLRGRISSDREAGVLLVVDGTPLTMEDIAEILSTHEGWAFELRIVDALE